MWNVEMGHRARTSRRREVKVWRSLELDCQRGPLTAVLYFGKVRLYFTWRLGSRNRSHTCHNTAAHGAASLTCDQPWLTLSPGARRVATFDVWVVSYHKS